MKCHFYTSLLFFFLLLGFQINTKAQANVTLATSTTGASSILQGSSVNILYIAKMDVAMAATNVSSVDVSIAGTVNGTDLTVMSVYFNATSPGISGATLIGTITPSFAAPHTYTISAPQAMAIGSSGYFIVTCNTSTSATDGNTIVINGAASPLMFGFNTAVNITNNQSDIAGTTTIQSAHVTIATSATAASSISKGSSTNILYIAKMDVATEAVTVTSVDVPIEGTVNSTDLTVMYIYFNPTSPSISGATLLGGVTPSFVAPHTYNINSSQVMAMGSSGYFIITVSTSATAVIGHTVKVNGATNPVVFSFSTTPNIANNQSDLGGVQTLPVNLVSLTAKAINSYVQLNWVTTSELSNASFDIERSTDGVSFITIGNIKSKVTTSQLHNYSFVDKEPEYGHNFYRLKQIDIDYGFKYSQVVEANLNAEAMKMSNVYPNPVKNILAYSIYSPATKQVMLQLSAVSGKILISQKITINKGKNKQLLNVTRFANGHYQLSIVDLQTNTRLNKKIIILQ